MRSNDPCDEIPHRGHIDMTNAAERARWAAAFNVSEDVLQKAVRIVGASITELRKLFCPDDKRPNSKAKGANCPSRRVWGA